MLPVQMRKFVETEEKLAAVGVGAGICHGENAWPNMLMFEVFIAEALTVYGLPACSVMVSEIAALGHETRNDPMKNSILKMQWFPTDLAGAFFSSTQTPEVFGGARCIAKQVDFDPTGVFASNRDVKIDPSAYVFV